MIVCDVLRRAGLAVTLAGLSGAAAFICSRGVVVTPDVAFDDVCTSETYDAVVLPGGAGGARAFCESSALLELLRRQSAARRLIACVCAAPTALLAAGVALGAELTSHPSVQEPLEKAYKYSVDRVVISERDNLITSRAPGQRWRAQRAARVIVVASVAVRHLLRVCARHCRAAQRHRRAAARRDSAAPQVTGAMWRARAHMKSSSYSSTVFASSLFVCMFADTMTSSYLIVHAHAHDVTSESDTAPSDGRARARARARTERVAPARRAPARPFSFRRRPPSYRLAPAWARASHTRVGAHNRRQARRDAQTFFDC